MQGHWCGNAKYKVCQLWHLTALERSDTGRVLCLICFSNMSPLHLSDEVITSNNVSHKSALNMPTNVRFVPKLEEEENLIFLDWAPQRCSFDMWGKMKHCQRHNGPEGWVHLSKETYWVISQVQTQILIKLHLQNQKYLLQNLNQTSPSRLNLKFKILTKPSFSISIKIQLCTLCKIWWVCRPLPIVDSLHSIIIRRH